MTGTLVYTGEVYSTTLADRTKTHSLPDLDHSAVAPTPFISPDTYEKTPTLAELRHGSIAQSGD